MIRHLKHHQIDFKRWDEVIEKSRNGLVYAFSWYLDIVSPGWEALVEGDYEYLMPLPVKRKFYIPYLTQPVFNQQLGVFSEFDLSEKVLMNFVDKITHKYLRCYLNFNTGNVFEGNFPDCLPSVNYILDLNQPYEYIYKQFNENAKRNIKRAFKSNLVITNEDPKTFYDYYCENSKVKFKYEVQVILQRLINYLHENNKAEIYCIKNASGEIIGGTFFINCLKRKIYMFSFLTDEGQEKSAMFFLINQIIQNNCNKDFLLDFEGSNIPGIARFFKGFGAEKQTYTLLRKSILFH